MTSFLTQISGTPCTRENPYGQIRSFRDESERGIHTTIKMKVATKRWVITWAMMEEERED